jgi:alpha-D-ribose 1-methylphosphonate 5-triphosphate synthase subunit PhnH
MSTHDLSNLGPGFTHEAFGSQAIFRVALEALSHPGRCMTVRHDAEVPKTGHPASAALLLALLDSDCTLWLSPSLATSDAAAWLRFHTGCQLVSQADQAMFAWVAAGDAMPALPSFSQGSDNAPDQSATCVLDLPLLDVNATSSTTESGAAQWVLKGPGIQDETHLSVDGLALDFLAQWRANHASFPRGVDLFLASAQQLVGLPRTTSIQLSGGL